jgi:glucose-6-phosphate 1-dehydrogenase
VRAERARLLQAVRPFSSEDAASDVIRGQYGDGWSDGLPMVTYRDTDGVARNSRTETYVALKIAIDSWRWVGVPFYLRTGKALKRRRSEIAVRFKQAAPALFRDAPAQNLAPNDLVIHIQPDEGISLGLQAKKPGPGMEIGRVQMGFDYAEEFRAPPTNGYETLLYDCMTGDRMLFKQAEEIEAGWRIVEAMAGVDGSPPPHPYAAGSDGPSEAAALLARDGRQWRPLVD